MSDTPKTDNELIETYDYGYVVPSCFARELEREVNALRAMNAQLQLDLEQRNKDYENLQALM